MMLQRFLRDRRAGVAPAFAAAIIPVFGLIGAAVDYSRASTIRTAMQSALDSTALALSKEAQSLSSAQLQTNASAYFSALFDRPELHGLSVSTAFSSTNGSQLVVSASGTVKTLFLAMWPFSIAEMPVAASATSVWGMTRLRVALALDNTGSMASDGKMTALKTASKNLLTQLKNAAQKDGDVYVSIVPFNKDVNAGAANYKESWIDWTEWDQKNGSNVVTGQTCTTNKWGKTNCTNVYTWTPADHSTWNGCVMDRDQNYDTLNTAPAAGALFPAEQYSSCPVALMPLSYDWTALNAKIDEMKPVGSTNQTIGLAWGWQSLTSSAPLNAPATDPNYHYQQVIILLTDGVNTKNRWNGDGSNPSSQVDTRTQKACDNIKAAGITLYTVLVMEGNADLLKNCASDPSKYFYLTSADQIVTTFDAIGSNLSKLRLAQ